MDIRDIKTWNIYFAPKCRLTRPPKDKFVVVAYIDVDVIYGFFINSKINPFITENNLEMCESIITQSDHSFLDYDSHVDCHEIYRFDADDLENHLSKVSENIKEEILKAVKACPTLEIKHQKRIFRTAGRSLND